MKKLLLIVACTMLVPALAKAQASGNFSASAYSASCSIDSNSGSLTGGDCNTSSNSNNCQVFSAGIKTSSGNGVTLVVTPSAVTGLYTNTKVSSTQQTSTAEVGIQVCVQIDGSGAAVVGGDSNGCAMYDERFQQLSTNLFSVVTACASTTTDLCNIDLILSTLSAHSYNFIAQVPNGSHTVTASWSIVNANTSGNSTVGACLGPGNVTVTQYKVFQNSGAILSF